MEQITRSDGFYYYGRIRCRNIDDAYSRFRKDYHSSLGKAAYHRLNRLGSRIERVHGYGFVFSGSMVSGERFRNMPKVDTRLLGLVAGSYCRICGCWNFPCTDGEFDDWFDWAFSKGSKALKLAGRNEKAGRTARKRR